MASGRPADSRPDTAGYDPGFITSAAFDQGDYRLSWLVNGVLVAGQPGVLGGPKKSLKTSLLVDLAVSVAGGRQFLGEFFSPAPCRVAVLSGESGEATLQDAARRVAASKGLRLRDLDVLWGFRLPQLCNLLHVAALQEALDRNRVKLLLFDPLYLALLAGQGPEGFSASNLYQIGPLLLSVVRQCLDIGCTPLMVHHFRMTRRGKDAYAEPQLDDLAFSGIQEFARQWILLGRRSPFDPDDPEGKHELWLSVGGSAGHSLLRAVDVFEGKLKDDFDGRTWRVAVYPPADARAAEKDERAVEKDRRKDRCQKDDEAKALAALDRLDPDRRGASLTKIRRKCQDAAVSRDRCDRALDRLVDEGTLKEIELTARGQAAKGYRRPAAGEEEAQATDGVEPPPGAAE
jgi:replicative DNA helicase